MGNRAGSSPVTRRHVGLRNRWETVRRNQSEARIPPFDINDEDLTMQAKIIEIRGANAYPTATKTRVGCRGIIINDSQILVSHEVNADYFLIPGGGLEGDETPEQCCVREIREETGYIVKPVCHFLTMHEFYEEYEYISHYFVCEIIDQTETALTDLERERGLFPEWKDMSEMLEMYSRHSDYAPTNEEKRGAYLREYTALTEYYNCFSTGG